MRSTSERWTVCLVLPISCLRLLIYRNVFIYGSPSSTLINTWTSGPRFRGKCSVNQIDDEWSKYRPIPGRNFIHQPSDLRNRHPYSLLNAQSNNKWRYHPRYWMVWVYIEALFFPRNIWIILTNGARGPRIRLVSYPSRGSIEQWKSHF